jgi:hypothetical protein
MLDPFPPSGAVHDVNPFGVYQNRDDGAVVFRRVLRCAPAYIACRNPEELDTLVARVFLAAARHQRRHVVVTETHVRSFVGRSGRLFAHSASAGVPTPWYPVDVIPKNVILCVDACHPEELGRLCYFGGTYGVSLLEPHRVCSVEVVPTPFGCGRTLDAEVLP